MRTLLFIPIFFLFQPLSSGRASDSATVTANTSATAPATSCADSDASAKKNSATPSAPAATAPKSNHAARPQYLFMD